MSDLKTFLMNPAPRDVSIKCHIERQKNKFGGMLGGYPTYALYYGPGMGKVEPGDKVRLELS